MHGETVKLDPIVFNGIVGRDISVGTATRYGLGSPEIEPQWGGRFFRTRPDRPWDPLNLLYSGYRVFPGGKATRAGHCPPTTI